MVLTNADTFSASLVGRFYLNGSMGKLNNERSRMAKLQKKRKEQAQLLAAKQAELVEEQEIIKLLKLGQQIEQRLKIEKEKSAVQKIQFISRKFVKRLRCQQTIKIQKWWLKVQSQRQIVAAKVLFHAVILRTFIMRWAQLRRVVARVQKWFRFWRDRRKKLFRYQEKQARLDLCQRTANHIVSRTLLKATENSILNVKRKESCIIIQKYWNHYKCVKSEKDPIKTSQEVVSRLHVLHKERESKFEHEKKLRLDRIAREKKLKVKREQELQKKQRELEAKKEREKQLFFKSLPQNRMSSLSKKQGKRRHSIDDVDQFKSPHFHFHLNKPKLSKHAKAIREGKAINQARKSFQRMANGLRQRYNLKYSAVIGQIRARLRVRKRQEIKQESSQKTSNELKEHGSGIKFLLSRQVS